MFVHVVTITELVLHFSDNHAVGWHLWFRDLLRQVLVTNTDGNLHVLVNYSYCEFRNGEYRGRYISNARGRCRDVYDDIFWQNRCNR